MNWNWSVTVTIALFVVVQTIGGIRWAAHTDAQIAQQERTLERLQKQQPDNQYQALRKSLEALKDRLDPIGSRLSRQEALQEGMSRSLGRLEHVFDEDRQAKRYFQGRGE